MPGPGGYTGKPFRSSIEQQALDDALAALSALSEKVSALEAASPTPSALSIRIDLVSNAASVVSVAVDTVSNTLSQLQSVHNVLSNRVSTLTRIFTVGGVILSAPIGATNVVVWRAPISCTVARVRGYRIGGTSAVVNARINGVSTHLTADLNLPTTSVWADGGAGIQNAVYAVGDSLEIMASVAGAAATQIAVQVDFTKSA